MPNIKSAIKRVQISAKRNLQNRMIKSRLNSSVKSFKEYIANKQIDKAEEEFRNVVSYLDGANKDNLISKNSASKKQAHYAKLLSDAKLAK